MYFRPLSYAIINPEGSILMLFSPITPPIPTRKCKLLCTCILIFFLFLAYYSHTQHTTPDENSAFEAFTYQLFLNNVTSDTLTLHYTIDNLEAYGLSNTTIHLGSYDFDETQQLLAIENQQLSLSSFSYQDLTPENQLTYDILEYEFDMAQSGIPYLLYEEPLTPYTGIHTQLPILLAEFPLETKEDVETYLALLQTFPSYVSSLVALEEEKAHQGLFMSSTQLETVLAECTGFVTMETNYLLPTFNARLAEIPDLTPAEIALYEAENSTLVLSCILPTYEQLIADLSALSSFCTPTSGLYYTENGRDYYTYLVESNTGSSRTIEEIQALIENQMLYDLLDLQEALSTKNISNYTLPSIEGTSQELLASLQTSMADFYPEIPTVSLTLKDIPSELEDFLSPAFYLLPTIDYSTKNTIYINNSQMDDDVILYTTLAHEGYPGHLYQTTYFASTNPDPMRWIISYGGYAEGWAVYSEMCSYYFGEIDDPDATILQKSDSLNLGLCAYTDIGIHYEGWTLEDTISFFQTYGVTNVETISFIYDLIISTPSNYLKYYLGYIEILELKKECIEQWGDTFTQQRFHEAILEIGPSPFSILSTYLLK